MIADSSGPSTGTSAGTRSAWPAGARRGALACRPGPQASTLHSGRHVKSPGAGPGLTPGPQPQVDACRYPPRPEEGTAPAGMQGRCQTADPLTGAGRFLSLQPSLAG
jgi:hypothetical protein